MSDEQKQIANFSYPTIGAFIGYAISVGLSDTASRKYKWPLIGIGFVIGMLAAPKFGNYAEKFRTGNFKK